MNEKKKKLNMEYFPMYLTQKYLFDMHCTLLYSK